MRRRIFFSSLAVALAVTFVTLSAQASVFAPSDGGYKLVPNWPTLPSGNFSA